MQKKSIQEILTWFKDQTSSELAGPRKTASKHLSIIKEKIDDIKDVALRFDYSDVSDPDVYQNYATTIYKKTLERLDEIEFPEEITFSNLVDFYSSCKNILTAYIEMLAKYLTWLKRDRSYKNKVKNLDRSITRLQQELYKFDNKTLEEYSKYEKYEEVISDLELLQELIDKKVSIENEIESLSEEVERLNKIIEEKEKELEELESHPGFTQLRTNKEELSQIEIAIANKIKEIKKLAHKVIKAADSKKIEINDYSREIMKALIKDPLEELIKENDGYSGIKSVVKELEEISQSPSIQMKKEKLEKAYENIDEIINGGLLELQKRAKYCAK